MPFALIIIGPVLLCDGWRGHDVVRVAELPACRRPRANRLVGVASGGRGHLELLREAAPEIPIVAPATFYASMTGDKPEKFVKELTPVLRKISGLPPEIEPSMYDANIYEIGSIYIEAIKKAGVTGKPEDLEADRAKIRELRLGAQRPRDRIAARERRLRELAAEPARYAGDEPNLALLRHEFSRALAAVVHKYVRCSNNIPADVRRPSTFLDGRASV